MRQHALEKDQSVLNGQIEIERRQLRITQLEQEMQRLRQFEDQVVQLNKRIEQTVHLKNERDMLDGYLRQALDDRQVYEKRSMEVIEKNSGFCKNVKTRPKNY